VTDGLTVRDLTVRRIAGAVDDPPMVGPFSFAAAPGTSVGVVGETGTGKTLTLRALMGLLPPPFTMEAEVRLGESVGPLRHQQDFRGQLGRTFGVVLQNPFTAFDPLKSVGSQIVEGVVRRRILGRDDARSRGLDLLAEMGFARGADLVNLYPHQLSGGMAQRIAIAMALMPAPSLVLGDEPTSALDASLRVDVLEMLRRYARSTGAVVVLASHDLSLVGRYCDQLIVMYRGRVVEQGSAREVLAAPQHAYTRALVACTPHVESGGGRRRLPVVTWDPDAEAEPADAV
jgi:ABC-type glutathione transport system ATPase component